MDERIQAIINSVQEKFGLDHYDLQRHSLNRSVTVLGETIYTLSMEWFPNDAVQEDDGTNPEGALVVEVDVISKQIKSAIFVMGTSYANGGVRFPDLNQDDIIRWLEQESGLRYVKQFQLHRAEERAFYFEKCIDGIPLSPSGYMEVKFDWKGNLIYFVNHGQLPSHQQIRQETYSLSFDKLEDVASEQLTLIAYPDDEQQTLLQLYAMEEIFVTNDRFSTIPYDEFPGGRAYVKVDQTMEWEHALDRRFERQELEWTDEVSPDQAFALDPSPDTFTITLDEQKACATEVRDLLRSLYPHDSGKWILKTLHRDNGYIHATLRLNRDDFRILQRKLTIVIDAQSLQVVNDIDNQSMLAMFESLQSDKVAITKEQAFGKLKELLELKPYYVYDPEAKQFVLCGKLDCHYAVNAASGEVVAL